MKRIWLTVRIKPILISLLLIGMCIGILCAFWKIRMAIDSEKIETWKQIQFEYSIQKSP